MNRAVFARIALRIGPALLIAASAISAPVHAQDTIGLTSDAMAVPHVVAAYLGDGNA